MPLIYNGVTVEKVIYNGTELDKLVYNGVTVFEAWDGSYTEFRFYNEDSSSRTFYLNINVTVAPVSVYKDKQLLTTFTTTGSRGYSLGTVSGHTGCTIRLEGGTFTGRGGGIILDSSSSVTTTSSYVSYLSIKIGDNCNCGTANMFRSTSFATYSYADISFSPNYSFTSIGNYFLNTVQFREITIPKSITSIGTYAIVPQLQSSVTCIITLPTGLTYPSSSCTPYSLGSVSIRRY